MSETLYCVSVKLPLRAADMLELTDFDYPVSVQRSESVSIVSVYSHSSFAEAEEHLEEMLELLEVNADFMEIDIDQIKKSGFEKLELRPDDYLLKYREFLKPFVVKNRLLVIPDPKVSADSICLNIPTIIIDSFLAFGTGVHPTTRMCLEYIADIDLKDKTVVDAGTGSGILAIASALLGAKRVVAFDNDRVAISTAKRNVELNGVSDKVQLMEGDLRILKKLEADVVIANLSSEVLNKDCHAFYACSAKRIAISGFLSSEEAELKEKFEARFKAGKKLELSGWVLLEFLNG